MIEMVAKALKVLNSETEPVQISLAVCFAMIIGLTPIWRLHNLLILLLVMTMRVNLSTFILSLGLFSAMAYLLDPLFHIIGMSVLSAEALNTLWTAMYNNIILRFSRFNNSVTMGSLVFSVTLFIPLLLILNSAIRNYREHLLGWVRKTRIVQAFEASEFYRIYQTISGFGGHA